MMGRKVPASRAHPELRTNLPTWKHGPSSRRSSGPTSNFVTTDHRHHAAGLTGASMSSALRYRASGQGLLL
jgi:hypothetical protein